MLAQLGARRVEAESTAQWRVTELDSADGRSMREEVDSLASRSADGTVTVLVWRHTDDQYQTEEQQTRVDVEIAGLDATAYTVQHLRIDATHSNAHTAWRSVGSPQDPSDEQLEAIRGRSGLEQLDAAHRSTPVDGSLVVPVHLPLPSVSLLVLQPA